MPGLDPGINHLRKAFQFDGLPGSSPAMTDFDVEAGCILPYSAVQPPSIERLAPVICAASSPQRNSASAATCSEVTYSLVDCAASSTSWITCSLVMLRAFMVSGICFSTSGVQT